MVAKLEGFREREFSLLLKRQSVCLRDRSRTAYYMRTEYDAFFATL